MKRIKKFYREHRVFTILMAIAIVCVILISTVLIQCFYTGNSDKYGMRLDDIENHQISDSRISDYEANTKNNDKVKKASLKITGRIIYISITFETNCDLIEAESIASKSLDSFSEEEKKYYDINITLKKDSTETSDGFLISGAHNKNGTGLVWNNNRAVATDTTEE